LVFEDSGGGIRSAMAAGLQVIGIATTHTKKELHELGCIAAFSDFVEVLEEIKKPQIHS
jgi:beta-phosphoglucomutase